jgi:hypothetical protein
MLIQNHQKQIQSLNQTRMMSLIQSLNQSHRHLDLYQLQLQAQYPDLLILIQSPSQTLTLNLS